MVDKTIKASAVTGAGVATIMFMLMLFNQAGDNPVGYCESTGQFCIAVDGFSGGQRTRCYNETDMNWWEAPYCSEGWQVVNNDLKVGQNKTDDQPIVQAPAGKLVKCKQKGCVVID